MTATTRSSSHVVDREQLAADVEAARISAGLTQRQLARQLGLSASTITRLLQHRQIDADAFVTILAWLDKRPACTTERAERPAYTSMTTLLELLKRGDL